MSSGRPKSPGADITGASERMRRDVIDEHLFVEALALTAFEINYSDPQPSNAEKVSVLILVLNLNDFFEI